MSDLHIAKVVITLANLVNSKKGFVNVQAANSNHEKWSSNKLFANYQFGFCCYSRTAIWYGPHTKNWRRPRPSMAAEVEEEDNDSNHLQSHKTSLGVLISTSTSDNNVCKNSTSQT